LNPISQKLRPELEAGLQGLAIEPEPQLVEKLLRFIEELHQWNQAFNLTAVREPDRMVTLHLLDSLAVAPWIEGGNLLDVGSGAGLPGLPLALVQPDREFTVLDGNGKKARFMRHAVRALELTNVKVIKSRIQAHQPENGYDCIISRAFAMPGEFINSVAHCCGAHTQVIAMQGKTEQNPARPIEGFMLDRIVPLQIPRLNAERHLQIYRKVT